MYRDEKGVNPDSAVGVEILKMFFGMNILERGKEGYAQVRGVRIAGL